MCVCVYARARARDTFYHFDEHFDRPAEKEQIRRRRRYLRCLLSEDGVELTGNRGRYLPMLNGTIVSPLFSTPAHNESSLERRVRREEIARMD